MCVFVVITTLFLTFGCDQAKLQTPALPPVPPAKPVEAPPASPVKEILPPAEPKEPGLTAVELSLKAGLEKELEENRASHRITLRSGKIIEGRIQSETPAAIRVRDGYGHSGYFVETYKRSDIAAIEELPKESFEITRPDLKLCADFPEFHFVKVPPYSIVTDESYDDVEKIVRLLGELRGQFDKVFGALARRSWNGRDINIVFFGNEDQFRDYAERVAPTMAGSAGFFSARDNRLALLNQLGSAQFSRIQEKIDERRREILQAGNGDGRYAAEVASRIATLRADTTLDAKTMTERLIRHEGAHQLFSACGVHSKIGAEPNWVTEGLAAYCEPPEIGRYHFVLAEIMARYYREHTLLPLPVLLRHHDSAGFLRMKHENTEAAYAQSWALVQYLMQPPRRDAFFQFIKAYREEVEKQPPGDHAKVDCIQLLEASLHTDIATFETQWLEYVSRM